MSNTEAGQILDSANVQAAPPSMGGANKDVQSPPAIKDEPISGKMAILMEQARQNRDYDRSLKSREESLKEKLLKVEQFESVKTDPKKALEFLGLSYDELTQSILKDGEVPASVEIKRLRDELDQHKAQLKQKWDLEAEEQKKQVVQAESKAVSEFKSEINTYLKDNGARYELIDFEGAHELVFDVIDEHYNRTIDAQTGVGKVLPIQEACDKVEEHLEKKYLAAKEKNKVKAFWANVPKGIAEQLKKQNEPQSPRTLTNSMGPKVSEKPQRPAEDLRVRQIVQDHMAKLRNQYA